MKVSEGDEASQDSCPRCGLILQEGLCPNQISPDGPMCAVHDEPLFDINTIPLRCDAVEWAFASGQKRPPGGCRFPELDDSMEPGAVIDRWLQARLRIDRSD